MIVSRGLVKSILEQLDQGNLQDRKTALELLRLISPAVFVQKYLKETPFQTGLNKIMNLHTEEPVLVGQIFDNLSQDIVIKN